MRRSSYPSLYGNSSNFASQESKHFSPLDAVWIQKQDGVSENFRAAFFNNFVRVLRRRHHLWLVHEDNVLIMLRHHQNALRCSMTSDTNMIACKQEHQTHTSLWTRRRILTSSRSHISPYFRVRTRMLPTTFNCQWSKYIEVIFGPISWLSESLILPYYSV